MIHAGRIYETDGAQAVGVHLAEAIRPLVPIPHAPSLRFFHLERTTQDGEPTYVYGNPSTLIGPSQEIDYPDHVAIVGVDAYLAVVAVSEGYRVEITDADDLILGVAPMLTVVARDAERTGDYGRAYDIVSALGPVITTPDELDDFLADEEHGRRYAFEAVMRQNSVEQGRFNTRDLAMTGAAAFEIASRANPVRVGDVFAIGPIGTIYEVQPADEIQVAIENLGTLSLKISS